MQIGKEIQEHKLPKKHSIDRGDCERLSELLLGPIQRPNWPDYGSVYDYAPRHKITQS